MRTSKLTIFLSLTLLALLASCVTIDKEHGYEQDPNSFRTLVINVSTKEDVLNTVGSPSTTSFTDDEWFYVTVKTSKLSLFKTQVIGNEAVKLTFKNNILIKRDLYKNDSKKQLAFNNKESSTVGKHRNTLENLTHNMGRFNKTKKKSASD